MDLDCGQNNMTITLPKSLLLGLDREHLRLIDVNCKASENLTHFFLTTELTACKTILRHKGDYTIYRNMVSEIPLKQNQVITRGAQRYGTVLLLLLQMGRGLVNWNQTNEQEGCSVF